MARAGKIKCKWIPEVPGTDKPSKMYPELLDLVKNRPLGNYAYVLYLQPGVADAMDAKGYPRDRLGQHKAGDIYWFLGIKDAKNLLHIDEQSKAVGFADSNGKLIDFKGKDAYKKAHDFNVTNKWRVANVVQNGDAYNVVISEKNSVTQSIESEINRALAKWDALTDHLTKAGVNMDALYDVNSSLINPGDVTNILRVFKVYGMISPDILTERDIETLLVLNPNNALVKNLMSRNWGTTAEVAHRIYDILHDLMNHTPTEISFVTNVVESIKKLSSLNLPSLADEVLKADEEFTKSDPNANITKDIKELNTKYGVDSAAIVRVNKKITRYSEAIADAAMSLERQIRILENRNGAAPQSEKLRQTQDQLLKELESKRYAGGLLKFIESASIYLSQIGPNIQAALNTTGTALERAKEMAKAVAQLNNLRRAYYEIVSTIANSEEMIKDIIVDDGDIQTIKSLAKDVTSSLDTYEKKLHGLERNAMMELGKEFLGESNVLYGKDLANIIDMKEADTSEMDFLYSVGRSTSATVSVMGAVIRDAQNIRNRKAAQFDLEIRRAQNILKKDHRSSQYMYDEKGRIVSPYDWDKFYSERSKYGRSLNKMGYATNSYDYLVEMQLWEDSHTTELEVDHKNHRTERVPIYLLAKDFQEGWTAAQKEYYDRIMEIKGQIGTLLPAYAQHQFIAPQKRTNNSQIIKEALQGKRDFKNLTKTFLERSALLRKKQGTDLFISNGFYVDGEEAIASTSGYDNSILRKIPIFYMSKIEDTQLSHDFGGALTALMTTAVNYEAMEDIRELCEMIEDYVDGIPAAEKDVNGNTQVDTISHGRNVKVITQLRKKAMQDGTSSIIDSFILKHIYGVESKTERKIDYLVANLIGYTSLKGLAVNVKGALTNKYVGVIQTMIEGIAGQYYNIGDWLKAEAILLGEQGASTIGAIAGGIIGGLPGAAIGLTAGTVVGASGMIGKFIDILTNNKNSKDTLIADFFDTSQEFFSNLSSTRYHSTAFGRLFGYFNPMTMYQRGEYWIHMMNVYATLNHEKVISYDPRDKQRKIITLYEALDKSNPVEQNPVLIVKDNIFTMDGKKLESIEDEYFNALRRRIRYINQQCHGSMNREDKGLIHQYMLGKLVMNFRQWMVEHYSRRWRKLHWDESIRDVNMSNFYNHTKVLLNGKEVNLIDALDMVDSGAGDGSFTYQIKQGVTTKDGTKLTDSVLNSMLEKYSEDAGWRRGFKIDTIKIIRDFIKDHREYQIKASAYWDHLSETQKADVKRTEAEIFMIAALSGLSFAMGKPSDHEGEFFYRLWMYVVRRCLFDEFAATGIGGVTEFKTMLNNLVPSAQTMAGLLYPVWGIIQGDFRHTIQSGRFRGWNKYVRNVLKYTVPFWAQIDQLMHIDTEEGVFNVFNLDLTR